jgi:RNA polymerase sigma factor (sigma-70 family)
LPLTDSDLAIVTTVVNTMTTYPLDREDAIAAGMLGLVEAERDFDAANGTQFSTFARTVITRRIIDAMRQECRARGLDADAEIVSIDAPPPKSWVKPPKPQDQEVLFVSIADTIPDPRMPESDAYVLVEAVRELPTREAQVLLWQLAGFPQEVIALRLGISRPRVAQLLAAAFKRLRQEFVPAHGARTPPIPHGPRRTIAPDVGAYGYLRTWGKRCTHRHYNTPNSAVRWEDLDHKGEDACNLPATYSQFGPVRTPSRENGDYAYAPLWTGVHLCDKHYGGA